MALKLKNRKAGNLKKVLIYGKDGSGKSTFAEQYCEEHNLSAVCIDIDDTNYTNIPIIDLDLGNDIKTYKNIVSAIDEIKETEFDTIILDGVTSLLEMLVSKAKGLKKYSDRAERFQDILQHMMSSRKNLIFIGQADMEVIYNDEFQSSKPVIKINSIVNEKYLTYKKKGGFSHKVIKYRTFEGKELNNEPIPEGVEPTFLTADKVEPISIDPVAENWIKTLCASAKAQGKPCRKGVLIACARKCERLSQEEKKQVIAYIKNLPDGEVDSNDI